VITPVWSAEPGATVNHVVQNAGMSAVSDASTLGKRDAAPDSSLALPTAVDIREVGLRDGLQLEDPVPLESKLAMIAAIAATGIRRVEATAFVSPRAVPAMADADKVAAQLHRWPDVRFSALVASPNGARRAIVAGFTEIEYVVSAADGHSLANTGRTTDEALALVEEVAGLVHSAGGRCEVIIATAWDCPFDGRTPIERTVRVARRAAELGADQLCLGDTIGTTAPRRVVELIAAVRVAAPTLDVGVHFHDTRGTGQANVLAAVQVGVTQIDASVGGLGGCPFAPGASGNIATEELVYMLSESGVDTGADLDAVLTAARATEAAVGHPLPSSLYRAGGRPRPLGRAAAHSPATHSPATHSPATPAPATPAPATPSPAAR
jgi:hydroxymethylglutaryl-CoA lyase